VTFIRRQTRSHKLSREDDGDEEALVSARRLLTDGPIILLVATIWAYWIGVGIMVARVRKTARGSAGLLPEQAIERIMWLIWVPLILAWISLPYLAVTRSHPLLAVPEIFLWGRAVSAVRWIASVCAVLCLLVTIECWVRMGKSWRIVVLRDQRTELVTSGLYGRIRHPIYAFSILLMVCSAVIVPTVPMMTVAVVHILLMTLKARHEERFLVNAHGRLYEEYCRRTGRFFPRRLSRTS
jgi:protein-S-isoprenylcysteine O-methyltransferase Ste14